MLAGSSGDLSLIEKGHLTSMQYFPQHLHSTIKSGLPPMKGLSLHKKMPHCVELTSVWFTTKADKNVAIASGSIALPYFKAGVSTPLLFPLTFANIAFRSIDFPSAFALFMLSILVLTACPFEAVIICFRTENQRGFTL